MDRGQKTKKSSSGANLGFEEKLWQAADVTIQDLTLTICSNFHNLY